MSLRKCGYGILLGCCFSCLVESTNAQQIDGPHESAQNDHPGLKCIVDVHGLERKPAQALLQTYAPQIQALEWQMTATFLRMSQGDMDNRLYRCLVAKRKQLIAEIARRGQFEFVDLQTVFYSQDNPIYTTLEIIDSAHAARKRFLTQSATHGFFSRVVSWWWRIGHTYSLRPDVIQQMIHYQALVTHLWMTHQLDDDPNDCPAYHCIASFHYPSLQPYFSLFQQAVVKDKEWIRTTLYHDPDPERRAAAALLIGHFNDPKEIISLLSSSVADPDPAVRNNVLRVIAATLYRAHLSDIDSLPFIALLDSPYVTDRNKALNILIVLAANPREKIKIIQYGGKQIVALLSLTQPDNHDLAYTLLKKLSHQHFGEHDERRWREWVNRQDLRKTPIRNSLCMQVRKSTAR